MADVPLKLPTGRPRPSKVAETNDDAQISKLSCVRLGYFRDPFVRYFVRHPATRAPLINRGYYARYAALRQLLVRFAAALGGRPFQVVSLGAGFDTSFWQLSEMDLNIQVYIELDVPGVCRQKADLISRVAELQKPLRGPAPSGTRSPRLLVDAGAYRLVSADLRVAEQVEEALRAAQLDAGLPTFVLCECVLVYMSKEESAPVLRYLADTLTTASIAIYEQINPDDAFGHQMLLNLEARGCPLLGICQGLKEQEHRLCEAGWTRATALNMNDIYRNLEAKDRRRIEGLEIFDEFEEWNLMQAHYCIALGVKDPAGILERLQLL